MRWIRVFFLTAVAGAFFLSTSSVSAKDPDWAKEVELPLGDPQKGREVFMRYDCFQCHRVSFDPSIPAPSMMEGPAFGTGVKPPPSMLDEEREEMRKKLGLPEVDYRPENYAMAVMSPPHTIAQGFGKGSAEDVPESVMPAYAGQMTVQELLDVVAYLAAPGETSGGTSSETPAG